MRLAFLTHEPFFPPSGGGSAEAVYLVREMVSRGHEVHIFCPTLRDPQKVAREFKVHVHEFKTFAMGRYTKLRNGKYLLYPFFLQRLVERTARTIQFDLIFSQHAISAVAAGRLKRSLRKPVVMNFLDYLTAFMETWPPYLAPPGLLGILKNFELSIPKRYGADRLLTVSDTLADYFQNAGYPRAQTLPIYYGYDSALFPFRTGLPANGPDSPVIVMHGSLDHHHLKQVALEAMIEIFAQIPRAVFRFVGHRTGALIGFLNAFRSRASSARIETTGFTPYEQVAEHLASADIGIVPYEESTGTHCAFVAKIVEYLAIGLPVVSTPLNSAKRYFHNAPTVRFASFNGKDFGKQVVNVLQGPRDDQALARQASARVQRELDWRAISRKAVDFTEGALAK